MFEQVAEYVECLGSQRNGHPRTVQRIELRIEEIVGEGVAYRFPLITESRVRYG